MWASMENLDVVLAPAEFKRIFEFKYGKRQKL